MPPVPRSAPTVPLAASAGRRSPMPPSRLLLALASATSLAAVCGVPSSASSAVPAASVTSPARTSSAPATGATGASRTSAASGAPTGLAGAVPASRDDVRAALPGRVPDPHSGPSPSSPRDRHSAATSPGGPAPWLSAAGGRWGAPADHLTVRVTGSGNRVYDGATFELYCHPTGGSHPLARAACDGLDKATTWRADPFAPVAPGTSCTLQDGGPARARVTGTWAGRPVDAEFRRTDGCEIARWRSMEPLLPGAGW